MAYLKDRAKTLFRSMTGQRTLLAAGVVAFAVANPSAAQDRKIVTIEDADFFGADYRTVKDVDIDGCKDACLADAQCKAFTFNTSANSVVE